MKKYCKIIYVLVFLFVSVPLWVVIRAYPRAVGSEVSVTIAGKGYGTFDLVLESLYGSNYKITLSRVFVAENPLSLWAKNYINCRVTDLRFILKEEDRGIHVDVGLLKEVVPVSWSIEDRENTGSYKESIQLFTRF